MEGDGLSPSGPPGWLKLRLPVSGCTALEQKNVKPQALTWTRRNRGGNPPKKKTRATGVCAPNTQARGGGVHTQLPRHHLPSPQRRWRAWGHCSPSGGERRTLAAPRRDSGRREGAPFSTLTRFLVVRKAPAARLLRLTMKQNGNSLDFWGWPPHCRMSSLPKGPA